jgi:hypothetical protein
VGISQNYLLKIQTSKQPIGEISGYEIILFHPLKYPSSKQGLNGRNHLEAGKLNRQWQAPYLIWKRLSECTLSS